MANLFISGFAFQDVCNISVSRYDEFLEATNHWIPADKVDNLSAQCILLTNRSSFPFNSLARSFLKISLEIILRAQVCLLLVAC